METTQQKTPTIGDLKRFERDEQTTFLRLALLAAELCAKETRRKVDAYTRPVFERFTFYDDLMRRAPQDAPKERLTDPSRLYLSEDEAQSEAFYAACDVAKRAHGYNLPDGHCPALIAEHNVIKAENALIEHTATYFPAFGNVYRMDLRKKLLDLLKKPPQEKVMLPPTE